MSAATPLFTVVIPSYNCADLLERALESVMSQTCQDFEVVVVDNSSTDHTTSMLQKYASPRFKVESVNNQGVIAYSRNKGVSLATGRWIAFLDADDVWSPEKLARAKEMVTADPTLVAVCHDEWHVDHGQKVKVLSYNPHASDLQAHLLFKGNCLSPSATCVRRDVFLESGGFSERPEFITVEDYEFWIRLAGLGKITFIDEALGEWHTHGANHSAHVQKNTQALLAVTEEHFKVWLENHPADQAKVAKGRARVKASVANQLRQAGDVPEAKRYAKESLSDNPLRLKAWALYFYLCLLALKVKR